MINPILLWNQNSKGGSYLLRVIIVQFRTDRNNTPHKERGNGMTSNMCNQEGIRLIFPAWKTRKGCYEMIIFPHLTEDKHKMREGRVNSRLDASPTRIARARPWMIWGGDVAILLIDWNTSDVW